MGQKINPRSLRHNLWNQSNWAYYASPKTSSVAWTQCLKNVMVLNTPFSMLKRFRALKAPSRRQRKKTSLWYLNHWLQVLPYSQWYHNYSYKWGSSAWQSQLSPIKMRHRSKTQLRVRRKSDRISCFLFFNDLGEMAEWFNAPVWKTGFFKKRGFKSHSFRFNNFNT
jgi:hypothetical protein